MNLTSAIMKSLLMRKLATLVLLGVSVAAFATLGDDGVKKNKKTSYSTETVLSPRTFSLRTGYNYRSNQLITTPLPQQRQVVSLNSVATYKKGNVRYVIPLRKKVLVNQITLGPSR
jgi:hypothetical protein